MIVGAGEEQIPAYERAKRKGYLILASDMSEGAPAVKYADYFIKASTRDPELTTKLAYEFSLKHKINGVMTIANDVPLTVAMVANRLGLKSISLNSAKIASDKLLMKDSFKKYQIPCPWYSKVESVEHLKELHKIKKYVDLVVKPIDGRGARGVLLLDKYSDYEFIFSESKRWGDSGIVMVEEFIPGMQLSTESFILNGKIFTPAIAERNYSRINQFRPNIIEDGGTIPPPISINEIAKVNEVILAGAKSMGISEGIIKGDIVLDKIKGPMIIELAARLSGGWFATHQIPEASGVDLVNVVMSFAMGEEINEDDLIPTKNKSTSIRYWFPPEGKVKEVLGVEKLKELPFLISYGFFKKRGDILTKLKMHSDRFGYVIVSGATRDESLKNVESALSTLEIVVKEL